MEKQMLRLTQLKSITERSRHCHKLCGTRDLLFYSMIFQIIDCDKLTSPENGVLRYSNGTTYQSVATFSCNPGYKISTNLTRTCKADKTWSNVIPSCIINGNLTNTVVFYSSMYIYECDVWSVVKLLYVPF